MKQLERNKENLLKYGISEELADKLIANNYTVSKIRSSSKKDLQKFLSEDEDREAKEKTTRNPIPDDVFDRLVKETELHCCFCWNIRQEKPIIIHHIDEYNKTQDNSFNNLIVLCLNHHGDVHTKSEISQQKFPKIRLLTQKEKWIEAIDDYRAGKRPAPGSESQDTTISLINSPGSIATRGQIGDNTIVNQNIRPKKKLNYFEGDTKPELLDSGHFKTLFVFGSNENEQLDNPSVELRFNKVFKIAKGNIVYTTSLGQIGLWEKFEHNDKKGYTFKTNILIPNHYLVIETLSKETLSIIELKMTLN